MMNQNSATIFHITAQLRFGAGRYVVDTAIEQARTFKHSVMVCVSDDVDQHWRTDHKLVSELACSGIETKTIGDFFHRNPDSMHKSAALLRQLVDQANARTVVHAHTAMAAAVGNWARPDCLVATCHGWGFDRQGHMDLQDSLAYQLCDSVSTVSENWANRLMNELAVNDPKVVRIGLNLDRYPAITNRKVEAPQFKIATVCELTPRKGVDVLLKAMPAVWEKMTDAELHIIGHGDTAEELHLLAAKLDPGMKRVVFHGMVPNPYSMLGEFDLFVLPSRSDNMPIVLIEAMLAGLPIISTQVGGIPEIIEAGKCGTVVAPDSVDALKEEIIGALKKGRARLSSVGLDGEDYARRELDVRKTAMQLEPLYQSLRSKKSTKPSTDSNG
jgi:glycosyltransferase involved in cell wall biosynthesis